MNPEHNLEARINRMQEVSAQFFALMPASEPCPMHPGQTRPLDDRESWRAKEARFADCPLCAAAEHQQRETERLLRSGVPSNLLHATLDNWIADDQASKANLETVRRFASTRRGFLILLGDPGNGKSHLAAGILRLFRKGIFVKQAALLRKLRLTYRDRTAVDPVESARKASCLVIDDVGLSGGGRDEFPMLHDILGHRHDEFLPTVLTTNLAFEDLAEVLGDRMADRLRESAFAILTFGGDSKRTAAKARYFQST